MKNNLVSNSRGVTDPLTALFSICVLGYLLMHVIAWFAALWSPKTTFADFKGIIYGLLAGVSFVITCLIISYFVGWVQKRKKQCVDTQALRNLTQKDLEREYQIGMEKIRKDGEESTFM